MFCIVFGGLNTRTCLDTYICTHTNRYLLLPLKEELDLEKIKFRLSLWLSAARKSFVTTLTSVLSDIQRSARAVVFGPTSHERQASDKM